MFGIEAMQALGYWMARREQPRARDEEPVGMAEKPRSEDEQAYDWFRQREAEMWRIRNQPYSKRLSACGEHVRRLLRDGSYTMEHESALRSEYGLRLGSPEHVRSLPLPSFENGAVTVRHSDGREERIDRLRAAAYAQLWFDVIRAAAVSGGERG